MSKPHKLVLIWGIIMWCAALIMAILTFSLIVPPLFALYSCVLCFGGSMTVSSWELQRTKYNAYRDEEKIADEHRHLQGLLFGTQQERDARTAALKNAIEANSTLQAALEEAQDERDFLRKMIEA